MFILKIIIFYSNDGRLTLSIVLVVVFFLTFIIYRIDNHREREMTWILDTIKAEKNIKHCNFDTDTTRNSF